MRNYLNAVLSIYLFYTFFPFHSVDKGLAPYINNSMKIVEQKCKPGGYFKGYYNPGKRIIKFEKLEDDVIGYCLKELNSYEISIDPDHWKKSNENGRYQLIMHEISHCVINKKHVDNYENYMYPIEVTLSKEQVEQQFIKDLEEYCGK